MNVYFADRYFRIIGQASDYSRVTNYKHFIITDDKKTEEVAAGVSTLELDIATTDENRMSCEEIASPGHYIYLDEDLYTIVDYSSDTDGTISIYAENAGLSLINSVSLKNPDGDWNTGAKTLTEYFNLYLEGTGFEIGINDAVGSTVKKTPNWSGDDTVSARLLNIAEQFGYELSYSYELSESGFRIGKQKVNIHKKRGFEKPLQLRLGREVEKITSKKDINSLATALLVVGGSLQSGEPQTLEGYNYSNPDNDFKVERLYFNDRKMYKACLVSPKALEEYGLVVNGAKKHIIKVFNSEHISLEELAKASAEELTKCSKPAETFEISLSEVMRDIEIGDRLRVVDYTTQKVIKSRVIKIETSVIKESMIVTLGESTSELIGLTSFMQIIEQNKNLPGLLKITRERATNYSKTEPPTEGWKEV